MLQGLKCQVVIAERIIDVSKVELVSDSLSASGVSIELRGVGWFVKRRIQITLVIALSTAVV